MASYDFAAAEALRWQLSRFFPELISNNRFSCIRVSSQATTDQNTKKRPEGQSAVHNNNVQATVWLRFKEKSLSAPKQTSPANMKKAKRLRQLYIQYRELVWEADKDIVADDPVIYKMLQYMHSDLDKAIALLQAALDGDRAAETRAYNESLNEWQQMWQEKRQPTETMPDEVPGTKPAVPDPKTIVKLPLPPPLPPCLQCVLANTCCSLTTTPYTRAYMDDLAGPSSKSSVPEQPKLQNILDEHAHLVAEHGSCDNTEGESVSVATLTEKKRAFNQRLLLEAIVRGDCDSPFLPDPPAQCARCQRLGDRDCLQQSCDLTGTTDTLALDKHGHHKSAWFASSGPPPQSLLQQHCPPLLRQMTESAVPDALRDVPRLKKRPILEAIYCRDDTSLTAGEVAVKAKRLLERIHRRNRWRTTMDTDDDAVEPLLAMSPTSRKSPTTAPDVPQISKEPVPAAAPSILARRLPKHSTLDVYAGQELATAAVPEARDKDGEQTSKSKSNLPRWRSDLLDAGVETDTKTEGESSQTVQDEGVRKRLAKCKESLDKVRRTSVPAREKAERKGKEAVSREQLETLAGKYGISVTTLDRLLWRKGW